MSEIHIPGLMCDDEMGCGDYIEASPYGVPPAEWGIETRDNCTQHLCWDCVYAANDEWWIERNHYLSNPAEKTGAA